MIRFAPLILASACVFAVHAHATAANDGVDIDTAAQIYQAAAVREQVRASLVSMPNKLRAMFATDAGAKLSDPQLDAVTAAAVRGFRIDVFEPPALVALAANLDAHAVKKSMQFLSTDLGKRMVAADVAISQLDEGTIDKIMSGEITAPSNPQRDLLIKELEAAAQSTNSAVKIYINIGRSLAFGTAVGGGMDPVAADDRARKSIDAGAQETMAHSMQAPLQRYMAYGYRDLSDADLKGLLAFLTSPAGKRYVTAYNAAMNAGFDAMGRRCGEEIGESWRELARVQPTEQPPAATP
jgi:hypothetical protein